MALLRPLESGESYLGMLLCDIQVLELNLTEGANGVPTHCLRVGKAFLWRDCLDLTAYTIMKSPPSTYFTARVPWWRTWGAEG